MEESVFARMSALDAEHWWFVSRRRILRDQIAALGLPPGARILEAGCGPGGNLPMLAEFGHVTGCEPNEEARRLAERRTGLTVRDATLPGDTLFPPESFDLVAAFDVIEHIEDDAGAVRSLAGLLKPDAPFIMTVPAYAWLWSEHDRRHHHKRRYTRQEARRLIEGAGLAVERLSHYNTILVPAIVAHRVLTRLLRLDLGPDDAMPPPVVNRILTAIFGFERHLLRHVSLPVGISILCIARKR